MAAWNPVFTNHLLTVLALLDASAMCVLLRMLKNVCVCVGWCVLVRGMQVNSLRWPKVPQASLAHHLTAIPDEVLRTNELVKQMSEQAWEGGGRGGWCTRLQPLQLDLPACIHQLSLPIIPLPLTLFSTFCHCVSLSVPVSVSVCPFPSYSFSHTCVIPLFY